MSTLFLEFELEAGPLTKFVVGTMLGAGAILLWAGVLTLYIAVLTHEDGVHFLLTGGVLLGIGAFLFVNWLYNFNARMRDEGN